MANKLFTFHRVGYRTTSRTVPNVSNINEKAGITWLNRTASDNIGPVEMRKGGWVGGNHLVNGTRTAVTKSVSIYCDGAKMTAASGEVKCNKVSIDVVNNLLDPSSSVTTEGTFSATMITEEVHYEIVRNAIEVTVSHTYSPGVDNKINTYYGMQSMFNGEDMIMTPHGPYNDFTPTSRIASFKFGDYPKFDRFIETNSSLGWCQAAHLLPEGIGDHRYVNPNHDIFVTSVYWKYYHVLIRSLDVTGGTSYSWRGVYSWFRPIVNDDDVLVYSAVLDGVEAIYVDAKRPCSVTFALPARWAADGKKVVVAQADNGITLNADNASQVRLSASGAGTAILKLAAR